MSTNSDGMFNCQIGKEDTDSLLGDLKAGTPLINYGINDVLNPGLGTPKLIDDHFDNGISTLQTDSITDNSDADPLIGSSNHHHSDSLGHSSHDLQPSNAANNTLVQPISDLPNYIDALLPANRPRWNSGSPFGTPVTITFSFMESRPSYAPANWTNFNTFTAEQREFTRQALQLYADVANINFVEVSDAGGGGTMRFGYATNPGAAGWAYYPSSAPSGGDVWMSNSASNLTPGTWYFGTLLHEIGHALGLKHPHDGSVNLPTSQDSYKYSNLSYSQHPDMPGVRPQTPQLFDVAAIQYLYGANTSTRTGDNIYSWVTNESFLQTIWDGGGTDTISAANQTRNAFINLNAGNFSSIGARGSADAKDNVAIAYGVTIENATGGSGNDTIYGNGVANFLRGGDGNDYLWGADGNDTLYGENGNDTLSGGDGNDYLWSDSGDDYLSGDSGDDSMYGGAGNDALYGGAGDDYLDGGTGNDSMYGGAGNDRYIVDSVGDVVIEYTDQGIDTIYSSVTYTLGDYIENLIFTGTSTTAATGNSLDNEITGNSGINVLSGGAGNDTLRGEGGNDNLDGGEGNDLLIGGSGYDILTGGLNADTFAFSSTGDEFDIISDFTIEQGDLFQVSASGFGGQLIAGLLAESQFWLGSAATTADHRFIYDSSTGGLFFDMDGVGESAQVQFASLTTGLTLTNSSILVAA
ncbi:M10 family metallopeptidase C-terminal domain-containing protein [Microcoleus sp. FACHB-53]|nr:M10 family metallopeptidase C-terminal domain-containing protein [Microcoleus sp. FACHB-53]